MGKDGWNKMPGALDEIEKITAMDGVDVYVAGSGGQAYDFDQLLRRLAHDAAADHASAS